jgi:hypothetical protein
MGVWEFFDEVVIEHCGVLRNAHTIFIVLELRLVLSFVLNASSLRLR